MNQTLNKVLMQEIFVKLTCVNRTPVYSKHKSWSQGGFAVYYNFDSEMSWIFLSYDLMYLLDAKFRFINHKIIICHSLDKLVRLFRWWRFFLSYPGSWVRQVIRLFSNKIYIVFHCWSKLSIYRYTCTSMSWQYFKCIS